MIKINLGGLFVFSANPASVCTYEEANTISSDHGDENEIITTAETTELAASVYTYIGDSVKKGFWPVELFNLSGMNIYDRDFS